MDRAKEKVVIVTGAANGMGEAAAMLLAQEGAKVVATDIQEEKVADVVMKIIEAGGEALSFKHDVSSKSDWEHVVAETVATYGKLDGLVNNAGISSSIPFGQVTEDDWNRVMAINVNSVFYGTQLSIPHMVENGGGSIVNISSMAGLVGNSGTGPYTASKGAVRAFTKAVSQDYAKQLIRCNSIHPGYIATAMTKDLFANEQMLGWFKSNTPLPYLGESMDIAYAILYLISDESKFVTGVELPVDGGVVAG